MDKQSYHLSMPMLTNVRSNVLRELLCNTPMDEQSYCLGMPPFTNMRSNLLYEVPCNTWPMGSHSCIIWLFSQAIPRLHMLLLHSSYILQTRFKIVHRNHIFTFVSTTAKNKPDTGPFIPSLAIHHPMSTFGGIRQRRQQQQQHPQWKLKQPHHQEVVLPPNRI